MAEGNGPKITRKTAEEQLRYVARLLGDDQQWALSGIVETATNVLTDPHTIEPTKPAEPSNPPRMERVGNTLAFPFTIHWDQYNPGEETVKQNGEIIARFVGPNRNSNAYIYMNWRNSGFKFADKDQADDEPASSKPDPSPIAEPAGLFALVESLDREGFPSHAREIREAISTVDDIIDELKRAEDRWTAAPPEMCGLLGRMLGKVVKGVSE